MKLASLPAKSVNAREEDYWTPRNYGYTAGGLYTLRRGLENSINIVTARLLDGGIETDPEKSLDDICATAVAAKIYADCVRYYPFVLGAQPVRMIDLAAFYAAVANEGARPQPHAINSIEVGGRTIYQYPNTPPPTIGAAADHTSFYQLKTMLQGVVARGTARAIGALSPYVAGKTGTTEDSVDGWFIGFTNDVTIAVWVGYDNGDGKRRSLGSTETGARLALPIFEPIINAVWSENIAPKAPLSGPSPEAQAHLIDLPIDFASGQRVTRGGFVEHFRLGEDGRFDETQYQLLSRGGYAARQDSRGSRCGRPMGLAWTGRIYRRRPLLLSVARVAVTAAGQRPVCAVARQPNAPRFGLLGWTFQLKLRPRETGMWMRRAIVLAGLIGSLSVAGAQDFKIEDVSSARSVPVTQLKPGIIVFSDQEGGAAGDEAAKLVRFEDWARTRPAQRKFLALFPGYVEPIVTKEARAEQKTVANADAKTDASLGAKGGAKAETGPVLEKLYVYVAQARFVLDRPPSAVDLSRYVTLPFLERIDPAIKHKVIAPADVPALKDPQGTGNENPDRKWCTGRPTSVCIQSTYMLEGKLPLGIMLVNKLRDSVKKVSDHIAFISELSLVPPEAIDQAGLKELTGLDTPVSGVLEQNLFYVNQILKFGKFFGVFQGHPTDADKTVVTAFMALAIKASVLDERRGFENVPVLRNLVPAQVLMGKSSFNSGASISAGLPQYARNEIRTIASILARDKAAQ